MREIQILRLLCHENVINLVDICRTKTSANNLRRPSYYLVLEFCEHDLAGMLLKNDVRIELGEIKKIMQQLLDGLSYIHSKNVCTKFSPITIYDIHSSVWLFIFCE